MSAPSISGGAVEAIFQERCESKRRGRAIAANDEGPLFSDIDGAKDTLGDARGAVEEYKDDRDMTASASGEVSAGLDPVQQLIFAFCRGQEHPWMLHEQIVESPMSIRDAHIVGHSGDVAEQLSGG